jgi:hypothetical protein
LSQSAAPSAKSQIPPRKSLLWRRRSDRRG